MSTTHSSFDQYCISHKTISHMSSCCTRPWSPPWHNFHLCPHRNKSWRRYWSSNLTARADNSVVVTSTSRAYCCYAKLADFFPASGRDNHLYPQRDGQGRDCLRGSLNRPIKTINPLAVTHPCTNRGQRW